MCFAFGQRMPHGCWTLSTVTLFFQAGAHLFQPSKVYLARLYTALHCDAQKRSSSVLSVTHRPGTRESLGKRLACFGSSGTWSRVDPSCGSVEYSSEWEKHDFTDLSEHIKLLKAAWCHLEKNVLSLLPLGLPQEFSISKSHLPGHGTQPRSTQTRRGLKAQEGGEGTRRSRVAVSFLGFTWFARKIDISGPRVPSQ